MNPIKAYDVLRTAIPRRPELRYKTWPNIPESVVAFQPPTGPYTGFCYIATQVFCQLVESATPYATLDRAHFWAVCGKTVYDPTFDQFDYTFPYEEGKPTKFKTFSKRAQELLKECGL